MKKIFTLVLVAFASLSFVFANGELETGVVGGKKVINNAFQNRYNNNQTNWFMSIGAGAQIYFGDHDKQIGVGKRITPKYEITAGKWLSSLYGVRINANMAKMKGLTNELALSIHGNSVPGLPHDVNLGYGMGLYYQEFNYMNIHADFLFNWSNDISGYNPNRVYTLIPYAGFGIVTVLNMQKGTGLSGNLGFIQSFRVTEKLNINLDIKGNVFKDKLDGEKGGRNYEGQLSGIVGLQYSL